VIPARGGSTRIPGKNIKLFNSKPMICWPIRYALDAGCFSRIVVSTDDQEIADVARTAGAEIPYFREKELAGNHTPTAPVVRDAIVRLGLGNTDVVTCIYPTAAIPSRFLIEAQRRAIENPDTFVVSVGRHRSPLERAIRPVGEQRMCFENPESLLARTQDLPVRYFDAGKFYVATVALWEARETMMSEPFAPFLLPDWLSVDLDEPDDWPVAEALHAAFTRGAES